MIQILTGAQAGWEEMVTIGKECNLEVNGTCFYNNFGTMTNTGPIAWKTPKPNDYPKEPSFEEQTFHKLEEESAMRFNEGKAEFSYIMSMPNAMAGLSAAFAMGAKKYARDNWKKGLNRNELIDSALRHLMKAQNGEVFDEESGLDHLFHFAWNAMVLAEQEGLTQDANKS